MSYPTLQHRWFEEVWNQGKAEVIDELLHPHVVGHGLKGADGKEITGIDSFKQFYHDFRAAFPNIRVDVERTVGEGDYQVALCRCTATHTGAGIMGEPTGRPIDFTGMCMVRLFEGRIIESWNCFDFLTVSQQLSA